MKFVASGLRHDVDEGGRLAAEFSRVLRLADLELLNRVDGRTDHEIVEVLVGNLDAIDQIDVVPATLSVNIRQRPGLAERGASSSARRNRDAVGQLRELHE